MAKMWAAICLLHGYQTANLNKYASQCVPQGDQSAYRPGNSKARVRYKLATGPKVEARASEIAQRNSFYLASRCPIGDKRALIQPRSSPAPTRCSNSGAFCCTAYVLSAFGGKADRAADDALSAVDPMFGPAVRCKRTFIELADVLSCFNVSVL